MADLGNFSIRVRLAKPSQDGGDALAKAKELAAPNAKIAQAITLGMQKLVFRAQKERFTGQGPFPVSERKLGVVTGRLRRDLHAEQAVLTGTGYSIRSGSNVEYFGAHEVGFDGSVNVKAHTRYPKTSIQKTRRGKQVSIRIADKNRPISVRAHTRKMKVAARMPLRTAIEQHAGTIVGAAISKALRTP
jgi:hypothetical protein